MNCEVDRLWKAAKDGDLITVRKLLSEGALISFADWIGNTPLHWAARGGHLDVVDALLYEGADVNASYTTAMKYNITPLHWAAHGGHVEVLQILLMKGAEVNGQNPASPADTPLHWAARAGNLKITEILIAHGARMDFCSSQGKYPICDSIINGHDDVAQGLILRGASITEQSPLNYAALYGRLYIAQLLISKGADVNTCRFSGGELPLHLASRMGHCELVNLFLLKGADINLTTNNNETSLHEAIINDRLEVTELLLLKGADVNISTTSDNLLPRQLIKSSNMTQLFEKEMKWRSRRSIIWLLYTKQNNIIRSLPSDVVRICAQFIGYTAITKYN